MFVATRTTAQQTTSAYIGGSAKRLWWIVGSSGLLLGALGCSADRGAEQDVGTDVVLGSKTAIFGGSRDDDQHAVSSVVALKVGAHGNYELCSGALVAPNVVLTARHCVAKALTTEV